MVIIVKNCTDKGAFIFIRYAFWLIYSGLLTLNLMLSFNVLWLYTMLIFFERNLNYACYT
ncbi:hypothetical protein CIK86_02945 [Pseudoalteromonas sp. JB197]|nr:hypothetical protein CIK86_02945 [Pseudoalteromonas sp. JB197]SJN48411.1 hypothetical protein CZ797_16385 [Pseudoalteromonas sp. JB197]